MTPRNPMIHDLCEVNYDGRICKAKVTKVNEGLKTFDVITSFKEPMYNIPFDRFKPLITLGNIIINELEKKYSLGLKTVDAMDMSEDVDRIIEENKWII